MLIYEHQRPSRSIIRSWPRAAGLVIPGAVASHVAKPRAAVEDSSHVPVKKLLELVSAMVVDAVLLDVLVNVMVSVPEEGTVRFPLESRNSTTKLARFPCWMFVGPLWNGMDHDPKEGGHSIIDTLAPIPGVYTLSSKKATSRVSVGDIVMVMSGVGSNLGG